MALTVPLCWMSVVYMYVVRGVIKGWNTSVENVTRGGKSGYESGKEIWKRSIAFAYGPRKDVGGQLEDEQIGGTLK